MCVMRSCGIFHIKFNVIEAKSEVAFLISYQFISLFIDDPFFEAALASLILRNKIVPEMAGRVRF